MTRYETTELERLYERWDQLGREERTESFRALPRQEAQDLFVDLTSQHQAMLLLDLPEAERRIWLRLLEPDDAADLIQEAPEENRTELLALLDDLSRREVSALLAYEEDEAGGLMSPRFARLRPDMTVDQAISYLRLQGPHLETIYYAYVLDHEQRLLGVVSFRDLFATPGNRAVSDLMQCDLVSASEETDQEEIARLFADHDLLALPVVDAEGRMKGIVTVDDIVDVVQEEASEDIQKIGGMEALDAPYLATGFWDLVRKRAGWLSALFVGEMLTVTAMAHYEEQLAQAIVLAVFIPLIISSGGNSGSQASTLVIRAMAIGEVRLRDWWRVLRREILSGLMLGGVLAVLGLLRVLIGDALGSKVYGGYPTAIGLTVGISLLGVVVFGTICGSMLPFLLRRVNLDPASASAPLVATLVDVTGLIIFFSVAGLLLSGKLL
ncbi:MAG: magnesium transporter [Bryobacterales bacterium]|nr:magnesium transporter [Bryobacterales bacterium]